MKILAHNVRGRFWRCNEAFLVFLLYNVKAFLTTKSFSSYSPRGVVVDVIVNPHLLILPPRMSGLRRSSIGSVLGVERLNGELTMRYPTGVGAFNLSFMPLVTSTCNRIVLGLLRPR